MKVSSTILTSDGTRIWINCYIPEKENGKVIIVAPGIGAVQSLYHLFACFYRNHGFTVISFDYRGMGLSAPDRLKGYRATLHEWAVQDINAVLLYARHTWQKHEIIYVGHCIGGEIIGLSPASQYISRMVLVSTALTCEKLWPFHHRLWIRIQKNGHRLLAGMFGYLPGGNKSNRKSLPRGVVKQMANWCDSDNGLFDAYPDNNYRKLNIPVLAYSFTDDWLCPPKAVRELLNHFSGASVSWFHLKPKDLGIRSVGHFDFFHPEMRSVLWKSLLRWLEDDWKTTPFKEIHNTEKKIS
ncbi:MAG: alpha/beta fold hydrolase [Chitinophagaceae bacterium]